MKLKTYGGHFYTLNGGLDWKAKVPFDSKYEIRSQGFSEEKWRSYYCGFCTKLHITRINKD